MMRLVSSISAVAMLICLFGLAEPASANETCTSDLRGNSKCSTATGPVGPFSTDVATGTSYVETLECGPRVKNFTDALQNLPGGCGPFVQFCPLPAGRPVDPTHEIVAYNVYERGSDRYLRTDLDCDVPVGNRMPSIAAIKDEITKRAPLPAIGSRGTQLLYNAATVFYLASPNAGSQLADPHIPDFTLGGHTFTIALHLANSTWQWGDGTSSTYAGPEQSPVGMPYTDAVPCETVQRCDHYISHTYLAPGVHTITATAHWTGTFTLDGSTVKVPIPGDIFRVATPRTITVFEAHSELVDADP